MTKLTKASSSSNWFTYQRLHQDGSLKEIRHVY